jgi:hypothetical protein
LRRAGRKTGQKAKGRSGGLADDFGKLDGLVQQRMERTFGAITLSNMATFPPRLSPFQSFGD